MADINRVQPGNPIIPPVPQDKTVDERDRKKQQKIKKQQESDNESEHNNDKDGIDYYA